MIFTLVVVSFTQAKEVMLPPVSTRGRVPGLNHVGLKLVSELSKRTIRQFEKPVPIFLNTPEVGEILHLIFKHLRPGSPLLIG